MDIIMSFFVVVIVVAVALILYGIKGLKKKSSDKIHKETEEKRTVKLDTESPAVRYSDNLMKVSEGVLYSYFSDKSMWICENCETENAMTENQCLVCGCVGNKKIQSVKV